MTRYLKILLLCVLAVHVAGCGSGIKVRGKVTYEEGTPLESGMVIFSSGTEEFTGKINKDGSYTMGKLKANSGIPQGTYKVCVRSVEKLTGRTIKLSGGGMEVDEPERYSTVESKFLRADSSGISIAVPGDSYDFSVGKELPVPPKSSSVRYVD